MTNPTLVLLLPLSLVNYYYFILLYATFMFLSFSETVD